MNGSISGTVIWTAAGNPFWIGKYTNLTLGSTLTVEAGVHGLLAPGAYFYAHGNVSLVGTAADPVVFASNSTNPSEMVWQMDVMDPATLTASHWIAENGSLWIQTPGDLLLDRIYLGGGIGIPSARRVSVTGSTFVSIYDGIQAQTIRSGLFSDNVIASPAGQRPQGYGILIVNADPGVQIIRNVIQGKITGIAVGSPNAVIMRNDVGGNVEGIWLDGTNGGTVTGNRVHDGTNVPFRTLPGILISGPSSYVSVIGNYVFRNRGDGIADMSSASLFIADNVIVGNAVEGGSAGVKLRFASQDIVTRNRIQENGLGVILDGGSVHRVYHNWILYNGVQASDRSSGSAWDDGYPSGGNHWSDYIGTDVYGGPGQNVPGPDGIGDSPWPVPPNGRDRYPFYSEPAPDIPGELTAQALGGAVRLTWRTAPTADSYFLYTASTPTGFDLASPTRLGNVTTWTDFTATGAGQRYYVLRAHNTAANRTSATSNTAGAWTVLFPAGRSTLSLPLAPYPWVDYASGGWVNTTREFLAASLATSLAYMEAGRWRTVPGDGDSNRTLRPGEGYLSDFSLPTTYTFTGLPAAMIDYASWPPYPLAGFDSATTAREISAAVVGDDVVVTWPQLPEIPVGNGTYEVYASTTPAGLRGYPGLDYQLLATVPATGAATLSYVHVRAVASSGAWYYLVVPVRAAYWRGASTYSVGVVSTTLNGGYAGIGLPLQPYANGRYVALNVSSLSRPEFAGVEWFDPARGDWVAHAAWMPAGMCDAPIMMIMAVQVDASAPTKIVFVGV